MTSVTDKSKEPTASAGRRRFLRICAASVAGLAMPLTAWSAKATVKLHSWKGIALGAKAEIHLLHENEKEALGLFDAVEAEVRRLETIFSLYLQDSELVRLNRDGRLKAPSMEMVELLGLCRRLHTATSGAFDPTIQPLWQYHAQNTIGDADEAFAAVLARTGFGNVAFDATEIRFALQGMAMTLNGIAQGFITDRVARLLVDRGCRDVLVDLGEISAIGTPLPDDDGEFGWPVRLRPDSNHPTEARIRLVGSAVASSARSGTTFDQAGRLSHIVDPRTGRPLSQGLSGASVVAPTAALADGLSTAALICEEAAFASILNEFTQTRAFVVRDNGSSGWL